MLLTIALSALAMTAIVAARYAVSSGLFAWLTERRLPGRHASLRPQIRREIGWSLGSAAIYGVPAGIVAWGWQARGWTRIYEDWSAFPLWYAPLSVLLYLLLHAVHHASRPPTAWAAMSFHPWEAVIGAIVIPLLVFLVPIHVAMLGVVLTVMTVMGVTNHMGWEMLPKHVVNSTLGNWLITASHHQRHHEEYRCNYGLYFRFWDRICGTDRGLSRSF